MVSQGTSSPKLKTASYGDRDLTLHRVNNCPICKGAQLWVVGKTRTINASSELYLDIVGCKNCAHWFISPIPTESELILLYQNASEYVVTKGWQGEKNKFSVTEKYVVKTESGRLRKKYLEVGIGGGLLFGHFRRIGYDCFGIEPGPWAEGFPNVVRDIKELGQNDFSVIVFIDVLEHLCAPLSVVRNIVARMNNGTVYASFPNCQSLRARLFKDKWRMVRPLGHLHFFSKESLSIVFESSGLRVKRLLRTDLIEFRCRSLLRPAYLFPVNMLLFFTERVWGDQWIVHLEK